MDPSLNNRGSFVWRSILWGRELLREGLRWKVGDGTKVRITEDEWVSSTSTGRLVTRNESTKELRVADFVQHNSSWNEDMINNLLLPVDKPTVLGEELPQRDKTDVRYWTFEAHGQYSVKSGYLVATSYYIPPAHTSTDATANWWKFLWSFDVPPRVRIFMWRAFKDFVPTEGNLFKHHVPGDGICGWCRKARGTTSHSLLFCEKIRDRWKDFSCWALIKKCEGMSLTEIGELLRLNIDREEFEMWLVGMWATWTDLCNERFEQKKLKQGNLFHFCSTILQSYGEARHQAALQNRVLPKEGERIWRKPPRGFFRLDVDYGVNAERGIGGVGAIVRDENGKVVVAMAAPCSAVATVFMGELKAIVMGICMCVAENIKHVHVFTDSLLAVHAVGEDQGEKTFLCEDIFETIIAAKKICVASIRHMRREANCAAHSLANLAKSSDHTLMWYDEWPLWLQDIVSFDAS